MTVQTELVLQLVDDLNAHAFSQPVTAAREHFPSDRLEDLERLRMSVLPGGRARSNATRGSDNLRMTVQVIVRVKLDSTGDTAASLADREAEEVDALLDFVDELEQFFSRYTPTLASETAVWREDPIQTGLGEDQPLWAIEEMQQARVFKTAIQLTFGCDREVS